MICHVALVLNRRTCVVAHESVRVTYKPALTVASVRHVQSHTYARRTPLNTLITPHNRPLRDPGFILGTHSGFIVRDKPENQTRNTYIRETYTRNELQQRMIYSKTTTTTRISTCDFGSLSPDAGTFPTFGHRHYQGVDYSGGIQYYI